jgi:hypothetical protein
MKNLGSMQFFLVLVYVGSILFGIKFIKNLFREKLQSDKRISLQKKSLLKSIARGTHDIIKNNCPNS